MALITFYVSVESCYHSLRYLWSSLLSKSVKIKIHKPIILPVVLNGCETWSLALREEHGLRVSENNKPYAEENNRI
jgi:hypothetical protein